MALKLHHSLLERGYLAYSRFARGMTLGVRGMLLKDGAVVLVKHSYMPGWYLPGGGVESGETLAEAMAREMTEEAGAVLTAPATLFGMYRNSSAHRNDHVALFVCRDWERLAKPTASKLEIIAAESFKLDALPDDATPATRARIHEVLTGATAAEDW